MPAYIGHNDSHKTYVQPNCKCCLRFKTPHPGQVPGASSFLCMFYLVLKFENLCLVNKKKIKEYWFPVHCYNQLRPSCRVIFCWLVIFQQRCRTHWGLLSHDYFYSFTPKHPTPIFRLIGRSSTSIPVCSWFFICDVVLL